MPSQKETAAALERIREEGRVEGVDQGRKEIIDWLQVKYLGDNAPDRESEEAKAILELAYEANEYFKKLRKV